MPTITVLHIVRLGRTEEVLRWIEFPRNATHAMGTVTWTTGLGMARTQNTLAYGGAWAPLDSASFQRDVERLVGVLGLTPLGLRRDAAGRSWWPLVGATAAAIAVRLTPPSRQFLVLATGATLPGLDVESFVVVPGIDDDVPMCLRDAHASEAPVCATHAPGESSEVASLPCPGYWPVTRVFVRNTQTALRDAIAAALDASPKLSGFGTARANLVEIAPPASTFLRDYWINLFHGTRLVQDSESLATTKSSGRGFPDSSQVINKIEIDASGGPSESGFGFGGNFLTCHVDEKVFLFHGGCGHQVGPYADDRFMIGALLSRLRRRIEVVTLDTGWLKVGHVDEILSFPRAKTALLASPALYAELTTGSALADAALNQRIEAKLAVVATTLTRLGITVLRLPVWFAPVASDPMHVRTVRGNAVNCIYIGSFAIHSQSGRRDGEARARGASSAVDAYVATVLAKLDYTSVFVDLQGANDEGGAGGNVHCATYTIHLPAMT
jgi:hypothetical protein